jgi:hypothetical protein
MQGKTPHRTYAGSHLHGKVAIRRELLRSSTWSTSLPNPLRKASGQGQGTLHAECRLQQGGTCREVAGCMISPQLRHAALSGHSQLAWGGTRHGRAGSTSSPMACHTPGTIQLRPASAQVACTRWGPPLPLALSVPSRAACKHRQGLRACHGLPRTTHEDIAVAHGDVAGI